MKKYLPKPALRLIKRIAVISISLGFKPLSVARQIAYYPLFLKQWNQFRKFQVGKKWKISIMPMLNDRESSSGELGEYFWQDLYAARRILELQPLKHIDVGSRIDGFVAHCACTREVEVFDIRPQNSRIQNVIFTQCDITNTSTKEGIADCVTSLHTIEHIGLGRYGDSLDPHGWEKAIRVLAKIVKKEGSLIISVPLGHERVEFNAHRIFNPNTILDFAKSLDLELISFAYTDGSRLKVSEDFGVDMNSIQTMNYCLGIFEFKK